MKSSKNQIKLIDQTASRVSLRENLRDNININNKDKIINIEIDDNFS